ncbi:MAG: hypothetical protein H0U12_07125 [Thermoleophilaceae bacterium]|nr:hypothetical protein [Thermoleophilaceae bacterium]
MLADVFRQRAQYTSREPERDFAAMTCCAAWHELGSCRGIGMATGPIPWTAIRDWSAFHRLDHDATVLLIGVIRYLDNKRAERDAARRSLEAARGGRS